MDTEAAAKEGKRTSIVRSLQDMSIGRKLTLLISGVLIFWMLSGALLLHSVYTVWNDYSDLYTSRVKHVEYLTAAAQKIATIRQSAVLLAIDDYNSAAARRISLLLESADQSVATYADLKRERTEDLLWGDFAAAWSDWRGFLEDDFIPLAASNPTAASELILSGQKAELADSVTRCLNSLMNQYHLDAAKQHATSQAAIQTSLAVSGAVVLAAFALAIGAGLWMSRSFAPLPRMTVLAQAMAQGDISSVEVAGELPAERNDEVGILSRSFQEMLQNTRQLLGEITSITQKVTVLSSDVSDSATQTAEVTSGLAESIEEVAAGAGTQAASLQEMATQLKELNGAIEEIARGAAQQTEHLQRSGQLSNQIALDIDTLSKASRGIAEASQQSALAATEGQNRLEAIEGRVAKVATSVDSSAQVINELAKGADRVGQIISLISEIAEQTNLLSLNAAIEAARAGEHGRGFAVVADEIRKLADQTSQSSDEVVGILKRLTRSSGEALKSINASREDANGSVVLVAETTGNLKTILDAVQSSAEQIDQVANLAGVLQKRSSEMLASIKGVSGVTEANLKVSEAMSSRSALVLEHMEPIGRVSEGTAAASEEVSASTEELSAANENVAAVARNLTELVARLQELTERFRF